MEPLLVLNVSLGDVSDEAMGYYLHIIGETRADDRNSPLHPSMEGVPALGPSQHHLSSTAGRPEHHLEPPPPPPLQARAPKWPRGH